MIRKIGDTRARLLEELSFCDPVMDAMRASMSSTARARVRMLDEERCALVDRMSTIVTEPFVLLVAEFDATRSEIAQLSQQLQDMQFERTQTDAEYNLAAAPLVEQPSLLQPLFEAHKSRRQQQEVAVTELTRAIAHHKLRADALEHKIASARRSRDNDPAPDELLALMSDIQVLQAKVDSASGTQVALRAADRYAQSLSSAPDLRDAASLDASETSRPHTNGASMKPRIFIGSSTEGLAIAKAVQVNLDYQAECTLWSQGVFGLSGGTLDSLLRAVHDFEFAILVLTPDDLVDKRGSSNNSPRDNVLFELGLFMGALGRERVFIVYGRDAKLDLPTDLAGVTAATFATRADKNLQAALGSACTLIERAVEAVRNAAPRPQ